jgi:hypothetical protein
MKHTILFAVILIILIVGSIYVISLSGGGSAVDQRINDATRLK